MPLLRGLNKDEQRALLHKIKNSNRQRSDPYANLVLDGLMNQELEKKLALISEEENFNKKNRYRL